MNELINELINDKAVYRTAPATPGLLNITGSVITRRGSPIDNTPSTD